MAFSPPILRLATTPPSFIALAAPNQEMYEWAMAQCGGEDNYKEQAARKAQSLLNDGRPIKEMQFTGEVPPPWCHVPKKENS